MKIVEMKKVMNEWVKDCKLPPLVLTGAAGIGKTQTVIDICRENNLHLEIVRIGSLDSPGDMLGLPEVDNHVTKFTEVEMWKRLENGGVLFLDEINRCKPVLMDSVMQILDQRKLADYDLSKCNIICAMNPDTDDYSVTDMDKAVIDRCLFIKCSNTLDDVANYFTEAGMDQNVVEFTLLCESNLKCNGDFALPGKELTPRGIRQLGQILPIVHQMEDSVGTELILSCVGPQGVSVWKNRAILKEIPQAAEFLNDPSRWNLDKMEPLKKNILLRRINSWLADNKMKDVQKFTEIMMDFGKVQLGYIMRNLHNINRKLSKQNQKFCDMAKDIIQMMN